jgi:type I restriction enzyme S subunit
VKQVTGTFPRGFNRSTQFAWPLVRADTLVELQYGKALPEEQRNKGRVPVYGTNGRCGWHDQALRPGPGIILGRKGMGPLGVEWCPGDYWVIDTAYSVKPLIPDIDLHFFYYLIKYVGLNHLKDGTSNPSLTRNSFGAQVLPLPPLAEQVLISTTLARLDRKIDVNQRIAETLEQVVRQLFKSWFVDFDPVRGTSTLSGDTRRLFLDRLADSRIGPVPEGWEVAPLGEHVEVTRGLSYTGAGLGDEGMPLHNLNSIREGGGYKEDGIKYYVGEYRDRDRARPGDVIVAATDLTQNARVIGCPAIVPHSFADGLYSQDLCRVHARGGSPLTSHFLYLLLASFRMRHQVASYANGTTVLHLSVDGLKKPLIAVPPRELVHRFDEIVVPMFQKQESLAAESGTLGELRDLLLPKLMSGEIRLSAEA